jgi:hypothetical protein
MSDLPEDRLALSRIAACWTDSLGNPAQTDRETIVRAVEALYAGLGKPAPAVIVCQSPWQMIMMKTVLQRHPDDKVRSFATRPSTDPFIPAESRWLWKHLIETYDRQVTETIKSRFALNKIEEGRNFWSSVFKSLVADVPLVGQWVRLAPSPRDADARFNAWFQDLRHKSRDRESLEILNEDFAEQFAFARDDRGYSTTVNRELVEYSIGSQPPEIQAQVIANLMSPVLSSIYRLVFARLDLELSTDQQLERELNLLSLMAMNELIYTRSLVARLPFFFYLVKRFPQIEIFANLLTHLEAMLALCTATPLISAFEGICLACEFPTESRFDGAYRPHCEDAAALRFSDGFLVYAWHGVRVSRQVIVNPEQIQVNQILQERNLELRRVLLERFGHARFLQECGARKVHEDKLGVLYRKDLPLPQEPLVIVKVKNSTPESDGTYKDYFLRVPPHVTTVREAIAWTFNLTESEYNPDCET